MFVRKICAYNIDEIDTLFKTNFFQNNVDERGKENTCMY